MVAILSVITASITLLLASQHALAQAPIDPSKIPSTCQADCSTASNLATTCGTDITCICSNNIVDGLSKCLGCAVTAGLATTDAQSVIDQFTSACNTAGHPVKSGSVTGSSGGGSTGKSGSGAMPIMASAGALTLTLATLVAGLLLA